MHTSSPPGWSDRGTEHSLEGKVHVVGDKLVMSYTSTLSPRAVLVYRPHLECYIAQTNHAIILSGWKRNNT